MSGERLSRDIMAARIASEFQDGWVVNLGIGMPTMCSDFAPAGRTIIYHSENGVLGFGRIASGDEISPYLVNAGSQPVTLTPYASIVHHADSFAIVRAGLLDAAVLGSYEVAMNGDFANWKTPGRKGGGIGGAMDIASCAKRVFLMMEHTTRGGDSRLLKRCTLPLTAPGVIKLVMTDVGLFEPEGEAFRALELAPGFSHEEVRDLTDAPVIFDGVKELEIHL